MWRQYGRRRTKVELIPNSRNPTTNKPPYHTTGIVSRKFKRTCTSRKSRLIPVNGLSYTDELNSRTCEVNEYIHHLTCLNISKKVEIAWCTQDRNTHKGTAENLVLLGHVIEVEVLCICRSPGRQTTLSRSSPRSDSVLALVLLSGVEHW